MIASVGHDPKSNVLEIEFRSTGAVWQYQGVTPDQARELINSGSPGRYFKSDIEPIYPATKVSG